MRISRVFCILLITAVIIPCSLLAANDGRSPDNKSLTNKVEPRRDFVVGIFKPMRKTYQSKEALLEDLDLLVKDEKNVDDLTEAFRQIEQTNLLTLDEKIQWIEKNQASLPPPFLILLANYLAPIDTNDAAKWFMVGSLRMEIDARKCADKDGTRQGNEYILERFMESIQQSLKGSDVNEKMQNFTKSVKTQFENAVNFHLTHPYTIEHPFWLSNHGARISVKRSGGVIIKDSKTTMDSLDDSCVFKPEKDWKTIEESVIYQLRKELS